jgi:hypothetical protein
MPGEIEASSMSLKIGQGKTQKQRSQQQKCPAIAGHCLKDCSRVFTAGKQLLIDAFMPLHRKAISPINH